MDKVLKIYKLVNGEVQPFPSSDKQAEIYSFQYDGKRMGIAPTITATIMYPICLDNLWDNNVLVEFKDERYFIDLIPSSSYSNTDTRYKHDVTFVSERRILENVYFKDTDNFSYEFRFFGDIKAVKDRINAFFETSEMGYTCVVDDGIETEEFDLEINNMYVNDALQYFFEIFDVPYYFIGKTLHFGYTENEISEVFEYGSDKSLLSINKDNTNDKVYTRITGVGSSENIPYYYPNFNESGRHVVQFEPQAVHHYLKDINYLKLDSHTNLREGGTLIYKKATIDKIGDSDLDNIVITNNSIAGSQPQNTFYLEWLENIPVTSSAHAFYVLKNIDLSIKLYTSINTDVSLSNILIARRHDSTEDNEYVLDVIDVTGWKKNATGLLRPVVLDYTIEDNKIKLSVLDNYSYITINLKKEVRINVTSGWEGNTYFCYDTRYETEERGVVVESIDGTINEYSYFDFNKKIDYPDGIYTYRGTFNYKVIREMAGYSDASLDSTFKQVFLDGNGDDIGYWNVFKPTSVVVKNGTGETVYHYLDKDSDYIYFRNTLPNRDLFTIEMQVDLDIDTPLDDNGNAIQALGVELEYKPSFNRIEKDYEWFKADDNSEIEYKVSGVKFTNTDLVPDESKIIFGKTTGWINPKPYLMPSVYRGTFGNNCWYNAQNDTYKDENGNYITFKNEYNPLNPKEYVAEPKEHIKPTIVGITNSTGQRIDMFTEVAFDTNDNNTEWETDGDGESQELKHSFFFVKLRKFDGVNGFNLFEQALETGEMTISMTSGHCGGCNFTIMVNDDGENTVQVDENGNLVRDDDGNVKFGSPQDVQQDTSTNEVWICLRKEEDSYGIIMPDSVNGLVPMAAQDMFVITNILLPDKYITDAEQKLERELIKELFSNNEDKFNFGIDFSRIYFEENNEIASLLNENSKLTIRYNGIEHPLYVSSYSYKMESSKPLPHITVEVSENLTMKKNAIQISENRIIREVKSIIVNQEPQQTNIKGGGGGTGNVVDVNIVQTTGSSTTDVMSQKAVTNALQGISNNNIEIVQYLGDSATKVMSQKATTNEFNNIRTVIPNVVQSTGQSTTSVMSQKAVSDAISKTERVLPFDGFVDGVEIQSQINPYPDGKIYFDKATNRFAYYREQDGIYTSLWNGYEKYATIVQGEGVVPNRNVLFLYDNGIYLYDGTTLVNILEEEKEIPLFYGIIDRATVLNNTGFNRHGNVYYIKNPIIDGDTMENGIFAYKIRDAYYRSWNKVQDYMVADLSEPIKDKLFGYDKQQYIYNEDLTLLSDIGRTIWKIF